MHWVAVMKSADKKYIYNATIRLEEGGKAACETLDLSPHHLPLSLHFTAFIITLPTVLCLFDKRYWKWAVSWTFHRKGRLKAEIICMKHKHFFQQPRGELEPNYDISWNFSVLLTFFLWFQNPQQQRICWKRATSDKKNVINSFLFFGWHLTYCSQLEYHLVLNFHSSFFTKHNTKWHVRNYYLEKTMCWDWTEW